MLGTPSSSSSSLPVESLWVNEGVDTVPGWRVPQVIFDLATFPAGKCEDRYLVLRVVVFPIPSVYHIVELPIVVTTVLESIKRHGGYPFGSKARV